MADYIISPKTGKEIRVSTSREIDELQDEFELYLYDKESINHDLGYIIPNNMFNNADFANVTDEYIEESDLYYISYTAEGAVGIEWKFGSYIMAASPEHAVDEFFNYMSNCYIIIDYTVKNVNAMYPKWRNMMKTFRGHVKREMVWLNPYSEEEKEDSDKRTEMFIEHEDLCRAEANDHYRIYGVYPEWYRKGEVC